MNKVSGTGTGHFHDVKFRNLVNCSAQKPRHSSKLNLSSCSTKPREIPARKVELFVKNTKHLDKESLSELEKIRNGPGQ